MPVLVGVVSVLGCSNDWFFSAIRVLCYWIELPEIQIEPFANNVLFANHFFLKRIKTELLNSPSQQLLVHHIPMSFCAPDFSEYPSSNVELSFLVLIQRQDILAAEVIDMHGSLYISIAKYLKWCLNLVHLIHKDKQSWISPNHTMCDTAESLLSQAMHQQWKGGEVMAPKGLHW